MTEPKPKTLRVRIIRGSRAWTVGDHHDLPVDRAQDLVHRGVAEYSGAQRREFLSPALELLLPDVTVPRWRDRLRFAFRLLFRGLFIGPAIDLSEQVQSLSLFSETGGRWLVYVQLRFDDGLRIRFRPEQADPPGPDNPAITVAGRVLEPTLLDLAIDAPTIERTQHSLPEDRWSYRKLS